MSPWMLSGDIGFVDGAWVVVGVEALEIADETLEITGEEDEELEVTWAEDEELEVTWEEDVLEVAWREAVVPPFFDPCAGGWGENGEPLPGCGPEGGGEC